ncbi:MAG: immune inhibitor A [Ignavibacteriae bacterium]|nr:immune inhibitor A [Ignavibacteriota bacterium]
MKLSTIIIAILIAISVANASDRFSQIRTYVPDRSTLDRIWSSGIDHEGSTGKIGGWMEFVAGEYELDQLAKQGISYELVISDLASYYESQFTEGPVNAMGFGYGSMGGFYTFSEVRQQLDSMKLLYPTLITTRDSVGRSQENRALWAVKISDNPSLHEPDEPEVLYTALHHAREPQGMMTALYYMWWLLENYGTNPEATYLVNNRQMWFIPVVNPDGYVYNQTINPNGGGMWRKNRRNNGGSYGVDPNRNYGPYPMWNAPNGGSSTTPSSETYRGPSEFSEPENQAIDAFMRSHNIKTCFNYHTYGNYLIYPWGYLSRENGDSLIYRDWTYDMTFDNHYTNGTDQQTVNYSTRGNSDDYMFGDTTKPLTYTMTPEVGTTGFWPTSSLIFPLAIENLKTNKLLSYFAGHYSTLRRVTIQDAGGNGFIDRNENFTLDLTFKNRGLGGASNLTFTATSSSSDIQLLNSVVIQSSVAPQQEFQISFPGRSTGNAVVGVPFRFYVNITDASGFQKQDTINLYIGTPTVVFADSASGGTGNWNTGQGWGLSSNAHTPPSAFTDSPTGNYAANANNPLTLNNTVNLTGYNFAELRFWTKWAIEPSWDFGTVEISSNGGSTWTTLRAELSHSGSGRSGSKQPTGTWGYESYTPGLTWIEQSIDLSSYVGNQIKLRFRVQADGSEERDGFYVDDIRVNGYRTNVLDTGVIIQPGQFTFSGPTGQVFRDSLLIKNLTSDTVQITISELTVTDRRLSRSSSRQSPSADLNSIIERLQRAAKKSNFPRTRLEHPASPASDPEVFTTIITDERNENAFGGADVYRVQHQLRTGLLNFHDFRIIMSLPPDSNIVGSISVDTDQNFGTGAFPTPYGLGPTSRDIGSEREIIFDASGIIIDSILGIGRIPAGVVISTATDTIVGLPFLLTLTRDSVFSIATNSLLGGIVESWLGDNDRNMNVGVAATRYTVGANPIPDFAPQIGNGIVGTDAGVSWLSEDRRAFTLLPGDSTAVHLTALAARTAGTYNAQLIVQPSGRPATIIPVAMTVTQTPVPQIAVAPTSIIDTLVVGDSSSHSFNVSNIGNGQLTYGILDTSRTTWLTVEPLAGVLDSGQVSAGVVRLNSQGLTPESTYTARFFVVSNDPNANAVPVNISMRVREVTGVENEGTLPTTYALYQNYPNPFNPKTSIRFEVPSVKLVTLGVFDLLGREVATLVNEMKAPGVYEVTWQADGLASGIYFYRLQTNDFVQTKKLVLIR